VSLKLDALLRDFRLDAEPDQQALGLLRCGEFQPGLHVAKIAEGDLAFDAQTLELRLTQGRSGPALRQSALAGQEAGCKTGEDQGSLAALC
jgi:hypothetical protein